MTTSMIHVRVDDKVKEQAAEALEAMGLTISDAVRIFLKRVVIEQALPIDLKVPNAETRAAIEESRAMGRARFASARDLFDDLEKPASGKRASLPRASDHTKAFVKDWERLVRSGRYNMKLLKEAMLLLIANDAPLTPEWFDHPLTGDWADHRECHIGGDFLLIYQLESSGTHEIIRFVRAGTHADLFE